MTAPATLPVVVLNGPNLARLGVREPEIYGIMTLQDIADRCRTWGQELDLDVDVRQTDEESQLVAWLHQAVDTRTHVVLNPAAFTHYSYALRDAAAQVTTSGLTLIEIHLSNPATRETFRHHSVVAGVATGTIAGFGHLSYRLALTALATTLLNKP
ncbi:type II 3-dehydroquinate dehydratase [Cellulomonas bogoriensis]|uniref:3-dehydroquinate dehydratase n=1 Tax=Cellulomonas bogoriensis 69B4 = DSM 16987 TaxID=1386082 RepID=A0A0A0C260_9CELL|nr:type II 3-dehydroquinate dehydratase [Cellulomonas bogoriensis]KGM14251.1 3-dehydroquinate dehydratase [Cellulomonas bogoriensis 69B4 = DSM 16987]